MSRPKLPATRADATEFTYRTPDGTAYRVMFEPTPNHPLGTHERVESVWTDEGWSIIGTEPVELLDAPMDPNRGAGE